MVYVAGALLLLMAAILQVRIDAGEGARFRHLPRYLAVAAVLIMAAEPF